MQRIGLQQNGQAESSRHQGCYLCHMHWAMTSHEPRLVQVGGAKVQQNIQAKANGHVCLRWWPSWY